MSNSDKKLPADGTVDSGMLEDGTIVNADVNASAAIAYSKLNLSGGIVNADVNASAAIAGDKLDLTDGVASIGNDGTHISIDSSGHVTFPLTSAVLVSATASQDNVTGDGTNYTVTWGTEIADRNSDFASNTFTAPVTGLYRHDILILLTNVSDATRLDLALVTSNRTYTKQIGGTALADVNNVVTLSMSMLTDMDSADTATVTIKGSNGTKIIDVNTASYWGVHLVA